MTTESKTYLLLIVPVLALFLLILTNVHPVNAQIGVPAGSYKNSCKDIQVMPGSVLWAQCEKTDGKFEKSTLQFARCEGDISNNNGKSADVLFILTASTPIIRHSDGIFYIIKVTA